MTHNRVAGARRWYSASGSPRTRCSGLWSSASSGLRESANMENQLLGGGADVVADRRADGGGRRRPVVARERARAFPRHRSRRDSRSTTTSNSCSFPTTRGTPATTNTSSRCISCWSSLAWCIDLASLGRARNAASSRRSALAESSDRLDVRATRVGVRARVAMLRLPRNYGASDG